MKKEKTKGVKKKKEMDGETKQLIYVLASIAIIFLSFIGIYFGIKVSKQFEYLNLEWTIENMAKPGYKSINVYHTIFPKNYKGENLGVHNLYLRKDPRKNNISVNISTLSFSKNYIVTSDPLLRTCEDAGLAFYSLGDITLALPFIKNIIDGSINIDNIPDGQVYADCQNSSISTTVVKLFLGNETKVYSNYTNQNCYLIELESCEDLLIASEKFVLNIIEELDFKKDK